MILSESRTPLLSLCSKFLWNVTALLVVAPTCIAHLKVLDGMQLTGVGMDPFDVEKQTLLMLLLSELFQQKGMPVASTNVTSVSVITSAYQSAGRRSTAGR